MGKTKGWPVAAMNGIGPMMRALCGASFMADILWTGSGVDIFAYFSGPALSAPFRLDEILRSHGGSGCPVADEWLQAQRGEDFIRRWHTMVSRLRPMSMPNTPTMALTENCRITVISRTELTAVTVAGMDLQRRLQRVDQIYGLAPQQLASVLELPKCAAVR